MGPWVGSGMLTMSGVSNVGKGSKAKGGVMQLAAWPCCNAGVVAVFLLQAGWQGKGSFFCCILPGTGVQVLRVCAGAGVAEQKAKTTPSCLNPTGKPVRPSPIYPVPITNCPSLSVLQVRKRRERGEDRSTECPTDRPEYHRVRGGGGMEID